MPIQSFSSVNDGLDKGAQSRGHFVANTDIENEKLWIPYADGVWFQPCCFNVTSGGFSVLLKGLPGAQLGVHYHVGTVRGYTLQGHWRYLEHDWVAKPGTFIYDVTFCATTGGFGLIALRLREPRVSESSRIPARAAEV